MNTLPVISHLTLPESLSTHAQKWSPFHFTRYHQIQKLYRPLNSRIESVTCILLVHILLLCSTYLWASHSEPTAKVERSADYRELMVMNTTKPFAIPSIQWEKATGLVTLLYLTSSLGMQLPCGPVESDRWSHWPALYSSPLLQQPSLVNHCHCQFVLSGMR